MAASGSGTERQRLGVGAACETPQQRASGAPFATCDACLLTAEDGCGPATPQLVAHGPAREEQLAQQLAHFPDGASRQVWGLNPPTAAAKPRAVWANAIVSCLQKSFSGKATAMKAGTEPAHSRCT